MDIRYCPCMILRCVLTLLTVHSVWCTSRPSALNPRVTDSSKLGESFGSHIPHTWPMSALLRIRRSLPRQRLLFSHDPTATDADPPFVILLLGKRRHGQAPRDLAWGHTYDDHSPRSLTRSQGHQDNHIPGSLTWPRAYKNHQRRGINDCLTPCYEAAPSVLNDDDTMDGEFLTQTLNPGLMGDPALTKLLFKKKKQKKTQEIRQALNRRYTADLMPSGDASGDSFLKEQQILDELMSLQKVLMKHQQTVKAPSLNDIQDWSGEDQHSLKPREAARGQFANDRDLILVNQRLGHVHKLRDSSHTLDGREQDGDTLNLPNSQLFAYSADRKLSAPSESFHTPFVSMDAAQVPHKQSSSQPDSVDPASHTSGDDFQYSRMNDVFQPAPALSRPDKPDLVSLPGASGHFLDNDKDCQAISSKDCLSDIDCSCLGFYVCAAGRCALLHGDERSANKYDWRDRPKDQLGWMDAPTDQQGWVGGPKEQYEFEEGPKDQHGWVDGSKDQHGWVDGSKNQHGFVDGLTNQQGWSNDPVMFELVPETDAVRGKEKQIWHEQPFDFSDTVSGAELQPQVNAMFPQQPKKPDLMGSLPVLEQEVGDQFLASGPDGFSDSIELPARKTSWSPGTHLLVDELGVVEG